MKQTPEVSPADSCRELLQAARYLAAQGRTAGALEKCTTALGLCPDSIECHRLLGKLLLVHEDLSGAIAELDRVVAWAPSCAGCRYERGTVRLQTGDFQGAMADFSRCLELDRDFAPAHAARALLLMRQRRFEEALSAIKRVVALRPDNDADLHNQGVLLTALGRYRPAIRIYQRALKINPQSGGTYNNLAWLLATCPVSSIRNGQRAVACAKRALALGTTGAWLDTLAAALAEAGEFERAAEVAGQAYERSEPKNAAFKRRQELYRRRISYAAWREGRGGARP